MPKFKVKLEKIEASEVNLEFEAEDIAAASAYVKTYLKENNNDNVKIRILWPISREKDDARP